MNVWPWILAVTTAAEDEEVVALCRDVFETPDRNVSHWSTEDLFTHAAVLPYCRHYLQIEDDISAEEVDDLQLVFEYFSSTSLKPGALAAMARRVSVFYSACPVGLKYLEPAALGIAMDNHLKPKSLMMRAPPTAGKAPSDPADLAWSHLAEMATDLMTTRDSNLMQAAAHRFLMGGERFPQNYGLAKDLLEQVALRSGHPESLAMLGVIYFLGLGVPEDKVTALRLLHLAAHNLKSYNAHGHLAVGMMKFVSDDPGGKLLLEDGHNEAMDLLQAAMEKEVPISAFNLVAYELLSAAPIKVKWLLTLSAAVGRGSPVAAQTLARLTSSDLMGIQTCSQAWSLMARVVRDDFWSSTAIRALEERGPRTRLTNLELMKLAAAGVEPAEWALSQTLTDAWEPRLRLLGFSAHLGRAAAQLQLAIASHHLKEHNAPRSSPVESSPCPSEEDGDAYLQYVLDQWENPTEIAGRLEGDTVAFANYEMLLTQRNRWIALDEEVAQVNLATAEAATVMAWMSFLGKHVEQNLRDAIVYLGHLRQLNPHYAIMQNLYYVLFQIIFSVNYALIMLSNREMYAIAAIFVAVSVLGTARFTLKGLYTSHQ